LHELYARFALMPSESGVATQSMTRASSGQV